MAKNAFEILGATPSDNGERIKELFEDKQLLLDDAQELNDAYAALTNPKKRIKSEIDFFASDIFMPFFKIFSQDTEHKGKLNNADSCASIISLGKWFDESQVSIVDEINKSRETSGFPRIDDHFFVASIVQELKVKCISAVIKRVGEQSEKNVITLFNALVKKANFQSFFIDELIANYEVHIAETLEKRQKNASSIFDEIERNCNTFNNGGGLPTALSAKIIFH